MRTFVHRLATACWVVGLCCCKPPAPGDRGSMQASGDRNANAPALRRDESQAIEELKSKLGQAIHAKSADRFVDCYFIEERFDTPEVREANRNQAEILLGGDSTDMEIREIPEKELVEIMKIQNAKPASAVRYSLLPRMMLRVRQQSEKGSIGRSFLIGERAGTWYVITLAGYTT